MNAAFQDKTFNTSDNLSLYYRDYEHSEAKATILCLAGLTRNTRDYEDLAPLLQEWGFRVLCLDFRGRGNSDYDPKPENYHSTKYSEDTLELLTHEKLERVVIIGTSLGGVVGMTLGVLKPDVVSALVLNDIGPDVEPEGLSLIGKYVGKTDPLPNWNVAAGAAHLVGSSAYPTFADQDWFDMARRLFRELDDGTVRPDYDGAVGDLFHTVLPDTPAPDLWAGLTALKDTPTLLFRGALTNILSELTVERMKTTHPTLEYREVADRGHVPLLTEPECLESLENFLKRAWSGPQIA
jgi:pimeloyl-ACP methyl ester carboxylesterase